MSEFHSADVMGGTLRLNGATLRLVGDIDPDMGGDQAGILAIASGAVPEVDGTSVLHGDLVNSGTLALGSADSSGAVTDRFTSMGGYTIGGSLPLDVNFTNGNADQLAITGSVSRGGMSNDATTTVNVRAGAEVIDGNVGSAMLPTNPLIDVTGTSTDGDSVAGIVFDGVAERSSTLTRDSSGDWNITALGARTSRSPSPFPAGSAGRSSEPRLSLSALETPPRPAESAVPQVAGNEALSLSAAAEVGWRLALGGVTLSSRAGLNWSGIEFEDFIDPTLARVSLMDGDTLTGLLGILAGGEWSSGDARGSLQAGANLHLPLDGETGTSVARVSLSNRLQKPVLELGAEASWKWGDLHSVYGRSPRRRARRPRNTALAWVSDSDSENEYNRE